jgi:mannose/fructose/N-acetylgalactosamine-specific phosphotransferase system component IID
MACDWWNPLCQAQQSVQQSFIDSLIPYAIPVILVALALFVFPRAGKRGWVFSLIVIGAIVAWFFFAPLRQAVGFA